MNKLSNFIFIIINLGTFVSQTIRQTASPSLRFAPFFFSRHWHFSSYIPIHVIVLVVWPYNIIHPSQHYLATATTTIAASQHQFISNRHPTHDAAHITDDKVVHLEGADLAREIRRTTGAKEAVPRQFPTKYSAPIHGHFATCHWPGVSDTAVDK